jgi:hypothetical protein
MIVRQVEGKAPVDEGSAVPTEDDQNTARELAEVEEEKESQVLEREPLETELMDDDRSEVGEDIEGIEDE